MFSTVTNLLTAYCILLSHVFVYAMDYTLQHKLICFSKFFANNFLMDNKR